MTIILWILLGSAAGWISTIMLTDNAEQDGITDIILGAIGAIFGGLLLSSLGEQGLNELTLYRLAILVLGSIIIIGLGRVLNRPDKKKLHFK